MTENEKAIYAQLYPACYMCYARKEMWARCPVLSENPPLPEESVGFVIDCTIDDPWQAKAWSCLYCERIISMINSEPPIYKSPTIREEYNVDIAS